MISIDDHAPSDPSSSHHQQQQQQNSSHDLKVSDIDLKSTDAAADLDDTNNPLPNFCIRDYVFGLRSKDIACNWPFSSKSLQLCLKHGVKNLLPPFQSLDCLRNNSSMTGCSRRTRLTDEELISSFDGKPANDQLKSNKKVASKIISGSKGNKGSGQTRSKDKPPAAQKPENASVTKKTKFVLKVNPGIEHVAPVSETMASKVCPVCKVFSSSSNTTLNAHIDQCLTGEGTMKWTDSPKVIVKHKVKPRKMRLMVDIYKTAPRCTIEELDRRNGTSWATNSSFPAQEFQFQGEEEGKEEPQLTKVNHKVADNEGHVYIDTNGTKVRILSVPKTGSSNILEGRKLPKGVKGSKLIMGKKTNLFKKKHHKKYLKLTSNATKLCSPKTKTVESCNKDERGKEIMKVADLGISRPSWASSKRTRLSKKLNGKNRKVELKCHKPKDLLVESSDKSSSGSDTDLSLPQSRKKTIISLSLVKRPMHRDDDADDGGDGSSDAYPSQDSDDTDDADFEGTPDANNRSKGSKFSSLSRNLSFPAPKFTFKRKFSAVEKSCAKSVDGPSQDSSREQSRMEEHTFTDKKQETTSSVGIQTVDVNELESDRNSPLSLIRAKSFMGLSNSFDPEFSNQECIELYQDQICSTNRAPDDVDKQENYLQEIDPIPIPGPPGSFLPASPGGELVSEEQVQETRAPFSENLHHHDTLDHDSMSNSPVSTVSNSRSSCGKDDAYIKPYFNGDTVFTETGQSYSFKNDQPCCCSRKETALNYHDSFTLRKQPTESKSFKSEMFPVSNYPNASVTNSTASPSKPVLRLMGKNLTVVETVEDEFRPLQSSQQHPQPSVMFGQYQNGFEPQHFNEPVVHRGFTASVGSYGNDGPYLGPLRSHYDHNIRDPQPVSGRNFYNAASGSRPVREIVIINDSPENEDDDTTRNSFFKGNQGQMNPLYTTYPSYVSGGAGGSGSTVFHGGSFRTSLDDGSVAGKWNIGSSRTSTAYHPPSYP